MNDGDAENRQFVEGMARMIYNDLRHLHPLADDEQLQKLAIGSARDQLSHMSQLIARLPPGSSPDDRVAVKLVRPSKITGGDDETLAFAAPKDLAKCETLEEVLSSVTIHALIINPSIRAMLAKEGYRLALTVGSSKEQSGGADVIDLKSRRKGSDE